MDINTHESAALCLLSRAQDDHPDSRLRYSACFFLNPVLNSCTLVASAVCTFAAMMRSIRFISASAAEVAREASRACDCSAMRRMEDWQVRKSCASTRKSARGQHDGPVMLRSVSEQTHGGDCGCERLDLALLGGSVLEAGQEVLRVKLVKLSDCESNKKKSASPPSLVPRTGRGARAGSSPRRWTHSSA